MNLARLSNNLNPTFPSLFDKFFEGDLMDWTMSNYASANSSFPAANILENDNEFTVELAAPGFKKEDFNINYDNGKLVISSEKKNEEVQKEGEKITRKEFNYQSFQRSFSVPEEIVNSDMISASYMDGILHVTMPKREEMKPKPAREIAIS